MKIKFLSMATIGLLFAACSSNDVIEPTITGNNDKAVVAISLKNASTRADQPDEKGSPDEDKIEKLIFYVFNSAGKLVQAPNTFTKQTSYKFVIEAEGADLNRMNFLVGVNQEMIENIPTNESAFGYVKESLLESLIFERYDKGGAGNAIIQPALFPMSGAKLDQDITPPSAENPSPVTSLYITVDRLLSKVEAPDGASATSMITEEGAVQLFGEGTSTVAFNYLGYVFINGLDRSDAFYTWNDETDWNGWKTGGKTNLTSEFDGEGAYMSVYAGDNDTNDLFVETDNAKTVYVFENQPQKDQDSPELYYDRNTVYSFIIKGELQGIGGPKDGQKVIRYWRANLIPDDDHTVYRNTIYRLTINTVNSIGYPTPEEAEKEVVPVAGNASVNITISVANWRVKTTNTEL